MKKSVPQIRFQGFNEEWEEELFEKIFIFLKNNTLSRACLTNNGIAKNIHYGDILVKFKEFISVAQEKLPMIADNQFINKYKLSFLQNRDVIISDTAEDETVGKCIELQGINNEIVLSGLHTVPCRPIIEFACYYLAYYMNANSYHNQLLPLMQGIKVTSISKSSLKVTKIKYPKNIKEQTKIGSFFEKIDTLLSQKQAKLVNLQNLKKAMLEKMFPNEGENIPQIRFKGVEEEWKEITLEKVCINFKYGLNAPATKFDNIKKYLRITDIDDNTRQFMKDDLTSPNTKLSSIDNYLLKKGDIVFARTGASVGKTYKYNTADGLVYYAGFLIKGTVRSEYDTNFVFYNTLTTHYEKFIFITSQRSGQPGVNAQEYATYNFFVSTLQEQTKIGSFFEKLDNLIQLQQKEIEKLQNIKKALQEKMFV